MRNKKKNFAHQVIVLEIMLLLGLATKQGKGETIHCWETDTHCMGYLAIFYASTGMVVMSGRRNITSPLLIIKSQSYGCNKPKRSL